MKDRALVDYDPLLTWDEIQINYNMPYTRFHVLHRMVPKGEFPAPIRLGAGPKETPNNVDGGGGVAAEA